MLVPLTTGDFLARGATVHPERVAIVDEPDQPAASLGALTFAEVAERADAVAAGLDALGVGPGERIAVVSPNAARVVDLFYGATASGRIVVPINFRLKAHEVAYIVEHSGASVLLVDPEYDAALADVRAPHRFVLGADSDAALLRFGVRPRP
jgi:fatty-acyl-CoA synthase